MGRRTKRTLPMGGVETFAYDAAGNMTAHMDFRGKTTTFTYNTTNRLLTKTPDPSLGEPTVTFTYTPTGRRASMNDASGLTTYTYDDRDRMTSKVTPQGTLNYTYDDAGNLLTVRSSNAEGVSLDYTYDELNRLATVKDNRIAGGTTTYTYDPNGNLASTNLPNGVQSTYTYNTLNRLTQVTATNGSTLASFAYTLGPAGNRLAVTEAGGRTVNYTYDSVYRLTSETISGDAVANGAISYSHDSVGNRLSRTSNLPGVNSVSVTYDANDRLTTDTYDGNGNTIGSHGRTFSYDFENHLTSADGGAVTIVYDGDGNRVRKTVGGVTTSYLVDTNTHSGFTQVVEEIQQGQVVRQYTYGHDLISQRQLINGQRQVSFYGYDGHGSVRYLTNAAGTITDTYNYDAFGNLIGQTGSTPNNYLYAGEQFDPDLGFYYLRARYMDTSTGRFATADTFEGLQFEPKSLHKYLYANADPVNSIDPSGHMTLGSTMAVTAMMGALAGMVTGAIRDGVRGAIKGAIIGMLMAPAALLGVMGLGIGIAWAFTALGVGMAAGTGIAIVGGIAATVSLGMDTTEMLTADNERDRWAAGVSALFTIAGVGYGAYRFRSLPNNASNDTMLPNSRAQVGELLSEAQALFRGEVVVARQVTIQTNSTTVRVDLVTRSLFGELTLIESKFGAGARFTRNQRVGYPEILSGGGTVRGANGGAALPEGTQIPAQPVRSDFWR